MTHAYRETPLSPFAPFMTLKIEGVGEAEEDGKKFVGVIQPLAILSLFPFIFESSDRLFTYLFSLSPKKFPHTVFTL